MYPYNFQGQAFVPQLAISLPSSLLATPAPNDGTTGIALALLMPILLVVVVQLAAILVGVLVSWLGGRGLTLMGTQPHLVAGLLVGTVLGVALFKGVPVGPLIAAGLLSMLVGKS